MISLPLIVGTRGCDQGTVARRPESRRTLAEFSWGAKGEERAAATPDRATGGAGHGDDRGLQPGAQRRRRAAGVAVKWEGDGSRGIGTGRTTPRRVRGRIARRDATRDWTGRPAGHRGPAAPPRYRRSPGTRGGSRRRRARPWSPRVDPGWP